MNITHFNRAAKLFIEKQQVALLDDIIEYLVGEQETLRFFRDYLPVDALRGDQHFVKEIEHYCWECSKTGKTGAFSIYDNDARKEAHRDAFWRGHIDTQLLVDELQHITNDILPDGETPICQLALLRKLAELGGVQ